jgi:4-diphosphocytidyl-2-C-methyl-D-erythritol kinase
VVGVRPDGLHELRAEMVTVDLADELLIDPGGDGLEVRWCPEPPPGAEALGTSANLVTRALEAVERRAAVTLTKAIPIGAGLGGGSADAAAVLRWAGCKDTAVARRLGSDVPFCVVGGRAEVSGTGEVVKPLPFQVRHFVLLLAPLSVPTAAVYAAFDRGQRGEGQNALTKAALAVEPRLALWRDTLGDLSGRTPTLAGSGATWFVEGSLAECGLDPGRPARGAEGGRLVGVTTVPAGWSAPEG